MVDVFPEEYEPWARIQRLRSAAIARFNSGSTSPSYTSAELAPGGAAKSKRRLFTLEVFGRCSSSAPSTPVVRSAGGTPESRVGGEISRTPTEGIEEGREGGERGRGEAAERRDSTVDLRRDGRGNFFGSQISTSI